MAIIWPANKTAWAEIGDETRCFFCARPLDPSVPAIRWDNAYRWGTESIALHPGCAVELGNHLVSDGSVAGGTAQSGAGP